MSNNALTVRDQGLVTPYLPRHVGVLLPLGSITIGSTTRHHLRFGQEFTESERAELQVLLAEREAALDPERPLRGASREQAVLALVTTMLLGFAFGDQSDRAADARFDLYEAGLDGVPAWAVAAGIARWARGECPPTIEKHPIYRYAPCPATLRALCRISLEPYEKAAADLRRILGAVSYEEAINAPLRPPPSQARIDAGLSPIGRPSIQRMWAGG